MAPRTHADDSPQARNGIGVRDRLRVTPLMRNNAEMKLIRASGRDEPTNPTASRRFVWLGKSSYLRRARRERQALGWAPVHADLSTLIQHAWQWELKLKGQTDKTPPGI